ncbi:MAG TPA: cytochrome c [Opitutaceae bacterium]|nr:cytochrome c [Opitutaceae bacterium]
MVFRSLLVVVLATAASVAVGAEDVDTGAAVRSVFQDTCARCHGDGTGLASAGIPNFTDPAWQAAHSDAELFSAIKQGRNGKMPPFGAVLSDAQISDLVRFVVRGFTPPPRQKLPGDALTRVGATRPPPGHGVGPVRYGRVGVYTQHNDNARTGRNLDETMLTPRAVASGRFGLLFRQDVDDQVFAQPLYVPGLRIAGGRHNVVFVATAANTIYAFDADRAQPPYWRVNLGPPGSVEQHHFWCLDILGNMGIIGTPVIDPATQTLYVVALTHEGVGWAQRLHALDLATGAERPPSPVLVTCPGFDPILENQRPALLLAHGFVYVGYSSHCDVEPYHGYLFRFDPATLRICGVFNTSAGGSGGSIWQSGQGPAVGPDGQIVFVTSNGDWDGVHRFGDTVLSLSADLAVLDWFTPTNYQELNQRDHDLNSSGAMVLPGSHEVIGVGKEGRAYLLDLDRMGHLGDEQAVQRVRVAVGEVNGGAVYWKSGDRGAMVYVWGQNDALKAYGFDGRRLSPRPVATGAQTSAYPGGMLSISANGERGGILWANAALTSRGSAHANGAGVLRAYDADDIRHELWDSNQQPARDACGRISKNAPPTVVNGKVYLASFGERPVGTGALYVYGLRPRGGEGGGNE